MCQKELSTHKCLLPEDDSFCHPLIAIKPEQTQEFNREQLKSRVMQTICNSYLRTGEGAVK